MQRQAVFAESVASLHNGGKPAHVRTGRASNWRGNPRAHLDACDGTNVNYTSGVGRSGGSVEQRPQRAREQENCLHVQRKDAVKLLYSEGVVARKEIVARNSEGRTSLVRGSMPIRRKSL